MLFDVVFTEVKAAFAFGRFSRAWYTFDSTNYVSTINYLSSFLFNSYNNLLSITNASLNFCNLKYSSANLLSIFILKNDLDSYSHQSIMYFDNSINGLIRFFPGNLKHISYNVLIIFAVLLLGRSI